MAAEKQYIDLYDQARETFYRHSTAVLNRCRGAAYASLCRTSLPTRKDERYKYIDLQSLFAPNYGIPLAPPPVQMPLSPLPAGVFIGTFRRFEELYPAQALEHYNRLAGESDALVALNTMLAQDGWVVYVERGAHITQPLPILERLHAEVDTMVNRRGMIIIDAAAAATLVVSQHSDGAKRLLSTMVTEVFLGEQAALDLTIVEESAATSSHLHNIFVEHQAQSTFTYTSLTLHNGITRTSLDINLCGVGAACQCNGAVLLAGEQQAENNIYITHTAPQCDSKVLYKYLLDDASRGVFAGTILVHEGAQQTKAAMRNNNICATPAARMQTQPMLEIYADDVQCTHGATVGQLNAAALFYMRSRGIPPARAAQLLQMAFMREVLAMMPCVALRERLLCRVERRIDGSAQQNSCADCPHKK